MGETTLAFWPNLPYNVSDIDRALRRRDGDVTLFGGRLTYAEGRSH